MKKFLTILLFVIPALVFAQADSGVKKINNPDSPVRQIKSGIIKDTLHDTVKQKKVIITIRKDTVIIQKDTTSLSRNVISPDSLRKDTFAANLPQNTIIHSPTNVNDDLMPGEPRIAIKKDELFYALVGIALFLAFIKVAFPENFQNLFRLFFQTSYIPKQTKEQLGQGYLASLLLNLLFVTTGGLFISLLALQYHWLSIPFWRLAAYCTVLLAALYLTKFAFISFAGWVFNAKEAASTYSLIVFLINKVMGILLLPLSVFLAFSNEDIQKVIITIAACLAVFLLIYRYTMSLTIITKNLKINSIHFFIYLCAVEIMPMLIIYKVLFIQIGKTN